MISAYGIDFIFNYRRCLMDNDLGKGKGMGLTDELLVYVIRWSVETCWVSDNLDTYQPNP